MSYNFPSSCVFSCYLARVVTSANVNADQGGPCHKHKSTKLYAVALQTVPVR